MRFSNPHLGFVYKLDGREYVVGPVKGVYEKVSASGNKAREHALLINDRPGYVTILTLGESPRVACRCHGGGGLRTAQAISPRSSTFTLLKFSNADKLDLTADLFFYPYAEAC